MADGAVELAQLAARLKTAGEVTIRREMLRGLRAAAKPLIPDIRASARAGLPKRGGLAEKVAQQRISTSVRTSPARAGVSIRAQFTRTDRGTWRHPVFGRPVWVTQTLPSVQGWFERGAEQGTPQAKREMETVLATVAAEVQRLGI